MPLLSTGNDQLDEAIKGQVWLLTTVVSDGKDFGEFATLYPGAEFPKITTSIEAGEPGGKVEISGVKFNEGFFDWITHADVLLFGAFIQRLERDGFKPGEGASGMWEHAKALAEQIREDFVHGTKPERDGS